MGLNTTFTTFVIGAGANSEVNMPTGAELKNRISTSLAFRYTDSRRIEGGNSTIRDALNKLSKSGQNSNQSILHYIQKASLISSAMPQAPSIDNFIDSHRDDPQVAECGKIAIVEAILNAEKNSKLFIDPSNIYNRLRFADVSSTWLNEFFQLLTLNSSVEQLQERLKKVRIVCFNYDRCIEHFLFHGFQNYYAVSKEQSVELMSNLQIFHPYGTVGSLPWQANGEQIGFGASAGSTELIRLSSNIRTFTEGTDATISSIKNIRSSIAKARLLVFLGFAYNELNLELLFGAPSTKPIKYERQVFGSAFGMSESNKKAIASELAHLGRFDLDKVTLRRELKAAELLPEYSRVLGI